MDAMSHRKTFLMACCCLSSVGCAHLEQQPDPVSVVTKGSLSIDREHKVNQPTVLQTDTESARVAMVAYEPEGPSPSDGEYAWQPVAVSPISTDTLSFSELISTEAGSTQLDGEIAFTLAEIEQIALNRNPTLAAAEAAAGKAAGLRRQVGTRPNPTLGYFGQQIADQNTDQHGIFLEQEFVRGNKLALNRQVLGHTLSAQRWETETQRYRVLTDIRVRFFQALMAQRQADATRRFSAVPERGVQVAIDRHKAEEGTLVEVLQAKTLLSEVTLAAEQAEVAYRGAWNDLAAIAGLTDVAPVRLAEEFIVPEASPDWNAVATEIIGESPELSVANALVCEKYALLKRQQVQMVPNITAQVGAGYDNATGSGMINLQFGAPIPVWNKNSGNISAAYADYARALENVKRIEQAIKSRLARVAQEYDAAQVAVKRYEQEIVPQAKQSLELSESAYQAGEFDFLQVLIVRRTYFESTIRMIAAQGRLAQANAKLDGLLLEGGLDTPADYTDGDGIRGASFGGL